MYIIRNKIKYYNFSCINEEGKNMIHNINKIITK